MKPKRPFIRKKAAAQRDTADQEEPHVFVADINKVHRTIKPYRFQRKVNVGDKIFSVLFDSGCLFSIVAAHTVRAPHQLTSIETHVVRGVGEG